MLPQAFFLACPTRLNESKPTYSPRFIDNSAVDPVSVGFDATELRGDPVELLVIVFDVWYRALKFVFGPPSAADHRDDDRERTDKDRPVIFQHSIAPFLFAAPTRWPNYPNSTISRNLMRSLSAFSTEARRT